MPENEAVVEAAPTPVQAEAPRTFTADEVTHTVVERLERDRKSLAKKLGVESLDEVQAIIEEHRKLKTEQMSEVEKAQLAVKAESERAAKLEAELNSIRRVNDQRSLLVEMGFDAPAVESLAGRLAGDDSDAWKADAEKFQSLIKKSTPAPPAQAGLDTPPQPESDPFLAGLTG